MADIQEYKCPCCGGAIAFDSTLQKMKCPFCDTEFELETLLSYDKDLASASEEDKMEWENPGKVWTEGDSEGMRVYVCKSCGGQIIGDANMGATSCPYCGNPVVMMGQFAGDLKPDYIIPFKLDKEAAKAKLLSHYKGKPYTPDAFIEKNHIDEIKGLYVPFWLFDAESQGVARFRGTQLRTYRDAQFQYNETSYYSIVREGGMKFSKIPVDASTKMADDLMESLEPFDFNEAVDFQTAYMAGYLADRYDVDMETSIQKANERIKKTTTDALNQTVSGYSQVTPEACRVQTVNGKSYLAMYPVWVLNTTWNGQKYLFAMNGQTGKMIGDIPIDSKKVTKRMLTTGGITAAVIFVIELALHFMGFL